MTLLRRIYLDLLGLPPQPEEVRQFLADNSPDAYERAVDRLLASPHYGERWGRHWLDAARYADSDTSAPSMLSVEDPTKTANTMLAILAPRRAAGRKSIRANRSCRHLAYQPRKVLDGIVLLHAFTN